MPQKNLRQIDKYDQRKGEREENSFGMMIRNAAGCFGKKLWQHCLRHLLLFFTQFHTIYKQLKETLFFFKANNYFQMYSFQRGYFEVFSKFGKHVFLSISRVSFSCFIGSHFWNQLRDNFVSETAPWKLSFRLAHLLSLLLVATLFLSIISNRAGKWNCAAVSIGSYNATLASLYLYL